MARIINSPGVQITEKDLSLRIASPVGTQVYIPGFASQGPTSEPIMITSLSEFESIFGLPSTPAERYFYYSCKEVLNSPAVLNAIRLPYGATGGSAFSNSYSGLFYPVTLSATSNIQDNNLTQSESVSAWIVGAPISKTLTIAQYENIQKGNFEWLNPQSVVFSTSVSSEAFNVSTSADGLTRIQNAPAFAGNLTFVFNNQLATFNFNTSAVIVGAQPASISIDGDTVDVAAGFFVLNDLQSTVNEVGEGYYIGFSDNSAAAANSPDFNSILNMMALSASEVYGKMDKARLDFLLSATKAQSDTGVGSVSEDLEKVGFVDYAKADYQDHLSVGIYKIRRSTSDATKLTLGTIERYLGSLNASRKVVSPTGGTLQNSYVQDIINSKSPTARMYVNPALSNFVWTGNSIVPVNRVYVKPEARNLYPLGVYTPDARAQEETKQIGDIPLKLEKALRSIDNPENIIVDVLADAGLSTIHAVTQVQAENGAESFNDEYRVNVESTDFRDDWHAVANTFINFAQNTRKDCFAIIDPPRPLFVVGRDTKMLDQEGKSFTVDVYNPLKEYLGPLESNYAAVYANWVKTYDIHSGKKFWAPMSGYAAAIFGKNDALGNTWSAPAGLNRGGFGNALDIAINPNQKQRDRLYELGANPVLYFNGDGYVVFGQKTLQNKPTAFDRINVRRLFLSLERSVSRTIQYFVFEPNTQFTRHAIVSALAPAFNYAKVTQGLYDFLIVCDERNNTPDTIDNNELIVDIYLKPVRTAEFILVNFIATRTGQNFQELL